MTKGICKQKQLKSTHNKDPLTLCPRIAPLQSTAKKGVVCSNQSLGNISKSVVQQLHAETKYGVYSDNMEPDMDDSGTTNGSESDKEYDSCSDKPIVLSPTNYARFDGWDEP